MAEGEKAEKKIKRRSCSQCNKSLDKNFWYYRDAKYFCNKRCWKKSVAKPAKAA